MKKQKLKKNKFFLINFLVVGVFLVLGFLFFQIFSVVKAGEESNARGWMWGGTEETSGGNTTGVGWISANNLSDGTATNYGVNIPMENGQVTGYAWSENLGWIDFNPQDHCGVNYSAASCVPSTSNGPSENAGVFRSGNSLVGLARIVGTAQESAVNNSGNWGGWLKMINVQITEGETGSLSGYAWNGEDSYGGLGFVDMSGVTIEGADRLIACPDPLYLEETKSISLKAYYKKSVKKLTCCTSDTNSYQDVTDNSDWVSRDLNIITVNNDSRKGYATAADINATLSSTFIDVKYIKDGKELTAVIDANVTCEEDDSCADECLVGEGNTCTDDCGVKHRCRLNLGNKFIETN